VDGLTVPRRTPAFVLGEFAKTRAFLRRDLLIALSYRAIFISDLVGVAFMATSFYFVGKMLDPGKLPAFNGVRVTYMEFILIGLALGAFIQIGLARVTSALRNEQVTGTLEALLMTPTAPATIQVGSAAYDLVYVPIRTAVILLVGALAFGLDFRAGGIVPALLVLLLFIPFVWGLGLVGAGAVLTFKRGGSAVHFGSMLMLLASGTYFPLELFPHSVASVAEFNPMAIAIDGMRQAMLGGAGVLDVASHLALLAPMSAASLLVGGWAFAAGLRREQRRGTLGLY
jgi:ABC-2 type transport system permease protein